MSSATSLLQRKRRLTKIEAIPDEIHQKLRDANICDASQVLSLSQSELIHAVKVSAIDAVDLIRAVSRHFAPRSRLATDLLAIRQQHLGRSEGALAASSRFVSTGIELIDELLHGGLNPGGITEILGTSGAGKTELCLSIAARCLVSRRHEDSSIVYIDADDSFSAERLLSLIKGLQPDWPDDACEQLCSNALVYPATNVEQLLQLLKSLETTLIERNTALICIDSIDSIVLRDLSASSRRITALLDIASTLKYLAETLELPVVCANHLNPANSALKISARLGAAAEPAAATPEDAASCVVALGVVWGHAVNTRLLLRETSEPAVRQLTIAKCPYSPVVSVPLVITERGVAAAAEHDPEAPHLQPTAPDSNFWEGTRYSFG